MSTQPTEFRDGNVGVRLVRPKRGRGIVLFREFEDAGGVREFTLYLDQDEAERLFDCGVDAFDQIDGDG